ncbi:uromodulin-like [Discoglossus pictus]
MVACITQTMSTWTVLVEKVFSTRIQVNDLHKLYKDILIMVGSPLERRQEIGTTSIGERLWWDLHWKEGKTLEPRLLERGHGCLHHTDHVYLDSYGGISIGKKAKKLEPRLLEKGDGCVHHTDHVYLDSYDEEIIQHKNTSQQFTKTIRRIFEWVKILFVYELIYGGISIGKMARNWNQVCGERFWWDLQWKEGKKLEPDLLERGDGCLHHTDHVYLDSYDEEIIQLKNTSQQFTKNIRRIFDYGGISIGKKARNWNHICWREEMVACITQTMSTWTVLVEKVFSTRIQVNNLHKLYEDILKMVACITQTMSTWTVLVEKVFSTRIQVNNLHKLYEDILKMVACITQTMSTWTVLVEKVFSTRIQVNNLHKLYEDMLMLASPSLMSETTISSSMESIPVSDFPFPAGTSLDSVTEPSVAGTASEICSKCDINAKCEGYLDFQTCVCKDGFEGDGYTCYDIDECSNDTTNNCSGAICINTNGSYICKCFYGFEHSSVHVCVDIDECSRPDLNGCHALAHCISNWGFYYCLCPDDYIGDGFYCEFNECTTGPCDFGLECIKTIGSFSCVDPCINHTILNDPWRSTTFSSVSNPIHCDSWLFGWYRFMGSGGIRLAETCPSLQSCNTEYPVWLSQSHPQPTDGIVSRTICGHWNVHCCHWSSDIQIKACAGGYHVYKFDAISSCKLGYCTEPATVVDSCKCTEDEECRLVDGLYGCYCINLYEISAVENLHPLLTCGTQEIKVSFRKCQLKSLKLNPNTIHLTDSRCTGVPEYNRTNIVSVVSLPKIEDCGNELIRNKTNVIYKNTIYLSRESNSSVGEDVVTITYSCVYTLDLQIDLDTPVNPSTSSINITMEGKGEFVAQMSLYQDADYLAPYEGSQVLLTEKSILYIRVILDGGDISQFNLVMKNCYATPTSVPSDPRRYYIIKDSCPAKQDTTINVDENGVSRTGTFSVQLFRYIQDLSTVFLHCELHICDVTNEACAPVCPGIKSLSGAFNNHVISVGPMTRQAEISLPPPSNDGTSTLMAVQTTAILFLIRHLLF